MDVIYYLYCPLGGKTQVVREPEKPHLGDELGAGLYPAFHGDVLSLPGFCPSEVFSLPPSNKSGGRGQFMSIYDDRVVSTQRERWKFLCFKP